MDLMLDNLLRVVDLISIRQDDQRFSRLCLWILCLFIKYLIIYGCLSRLIKEYIVHEAVPKINKIRLVNAAWRVIFSAGVITVFVAVPWNSLNPQGNVFHLVSKSMMTPLCNVTSQHNSKNPHSLEFSLLVAPVAFFLHQIYVSISEGSDPAVASMGCFAIFMIAADPSKCPNLSLLVLLLLSLSFGSLELAKVFYILKSRCRGFEGPPAPILIRIVAPFLFAMHIVVWGIVNFYLLPVLFLSLPSVAQVDAHSRFKTAYINIFLLFLFRHQFFDLPLWSLLKLVVTKPTEIRRMRSLLSLPAVVLLPYTSSLLPELRAIQMNFLLNALPSSAERRMIRKRILSSGNEASSPIAEEKADFLSFIKCVKILKRKMRYRYEQRVSNEASVTSESNEFDIKEPIGQPESDVTDIFVPVPSTSHTSNNNLISQDGNAASSIKEEGSNSESNDQSDEAIEECQSGDSKEEGDTDSCEI